jgi:choline transport protein
MLHIVGFVAIIVVMGVMAPKHNADFVFVEFSNTSGWASDGTSWLVGLVSTVYPFLGYDAACHLAEEMPRPARNVPLAMVGSVVINGVMGLGFAIVLLFSLGDLNELLTSPTGFPFMQLFLDVTKNSAGATILILIVALVAVAANAAGCTSTSRTFWAFARDDATPYSKLFAHVNPSLQVPVPAIVAVTVFQMLLGLLYLGNSTAYNAVLSMSILGMYASYILPIVYMTIYGRGKLHQNQYGPFKMGPVLGPLINLVAISWLVVAMIFSTFPSVRPVTPQNMNYSIVVMGGWLIIGTTYFFLVAKKRYIVPII